jgi:hypothetical protein
MTQRTAWAAFLCAALLISAASCNSFDLGGLAAFFGSGLTVVIENNTDFTAAPDLRTSDSHNLAEDVIADQNQVQNFGANGSVGPHQTVTARLTCNGDLESLVFRGADFREGNGFALGDVSSDVTLRRDTDFDCGDTIRLTLSGSIFRFRAEVNVERSSGTDADVGGNQNSNGGDSGNSSDLADWLDNLFN